MISNKPVPFECNSLVQELSIQLLKDMSPMTVFAQGITTNDPDGTYMTASRRGEDLKWIAVRGGYHDWAIYIGWANEKTVNTLIQNGDKVTGEGNIRKLVRCSDGAYDMYNK